jgi:enterobacterial common antigen flippase
VRNITRRDWASTFATNGYMFACGLVTGSLTARLLQPEGRGALAAVAYWPGLLAGIGCLSLNEALTYRTGRNPDGAGTMRAAGVWGAVVLASITALVVYPMLPALLGPDRQQYLGLARTYVLIFVPASFVGMNLVAIDQGRGDFRRFNLMRAVQPTLYLVAILGVWVAGAATVSTIAWANLVALSLVALVRVGSNLTDVVKWPSAAEWASLLRTALQFHALNLLLYLAANVDQMVVVAHSRNAVVGFYAISITMASASLGVIMQTFQNIVLPRLSRESEAASSQAFLAKAVRSAMLLLTVAALIAIAAAPVVLPLIFGGSFLHSVLPAQILIAASVPKALRGVLGYGLRGLGRVWPALLAEGVAIAGFLAVGLRLLDSFGLAGVAVALLVSNLLSWCCVVYVAWKYLALPVRQFWGLNRRTAQELVGSLRGAFASGAQ